MDRVGRARGRTLPSRRGAEPDAPDLPLPRGLVHREADQLQAVDHAVDLEQVRLPGSRRAGRRRERRHAHAGRGSLQSRGRSRDPPAAARAPRRSRAGSRAVDLLHVGNDGRSQGRTAHRPIGARRRDRVRREDARRGRRHRARRVPVHTHRRHHHRCLHTLADRLGGGVDGGVDGAGVDRADRAAQGDAGQRRGRDPHRARRRSARRIRARMPRCATSRAGARPSRRTCTTS